MDSFDFTDEERGSALRRPGMIWNILTIIMVLSAACVCIVAAMIFINPYLPFNLFPPPTLPPTAALPTATPTPRVVLPPTWTPTMTSTPTLPPKATDTPQSSATFPFELTPGEGVTTTPQGGFPFDIHAGDPVYIPNFAYPDLGCKWMGVGGRAFDLSGAPIAQGLFVQVGGTLNRQTVDLLGMIGMVNNYGTGSFEIKLSDEPIASTQSLWIQLFDQAFIPLSNKIYFDTFSDCEKNLILINFSQIR